MQKLRSFTTIGLVDIHFHGAFGIDLMSASPLELDYLSELLWKQGVAGFCPTTVSAPRQVLLDAVERLGRWIREKSEIYPGLKTEVSAASNQTSKSKKSGKTGAAPLGIHLEGPFLSSGACGAHPPSAIRKFTWAELQELWIASHETLKIITLAPETLSHKELQKLGRWSRSKGVILSLGHSLASQQEAKFAFDNGFLGTTHTWNAMPFHPRTPGILGAAIGRKGIYLELIIDRAHLSPEAIRWTRKLHFPNSLCFISDCLSAGGHGFSGRSKKQLTLKSEFKLGSQQVHFKQGACRLENGQLAGGGLLLSQSYVKWASAEAAELDQDPWNVLRETVQYATHLPLEALGFSKNVLFNRKVSWKVSPSGKIQVIPIDSAASSR